MEREMRHLKALIERYPQLDAAQDDILSCYEHLTACFEGGGKLQKRNGGALPR